MPTGSTIHTILQCFVDLNLETDENSTYSLDLLDVSFDQSVHNVDEGQIVEVDVSLSSPSINGYEEVDIGLINQSTVSADYNLLGETYPRTLTWSAGQQTHTLRFLANSDFFEEGGESFDLIIGTFINVNPGTFITSTVNIVDLTDLKEVFINSLGGNFQVSEITSANTLTFSAVEGFEKEITISLDSPSVFGIESATLSFTNFTTNFSDYSIAGSTNLSWAIGEQDKTFKIQATDDSLIEDTEILGINITNAVNANIINPSIAEFKIFDNSPDIYYANINLQGSYVQFGSSGSQNLEMRWVRENSGTATEPGLNRRRFIKFGEPVAYNPIGINQPNGPAQGYGIDAGPNMLSGYGNFFNQGVNVVWFGEEPVVNFSFNNWSIPNNSPKTYGDLKLKITNAGSHPILISGSTIPVGGSFTNNVDSFDYNITLPTNKTLISGGTVFQNTVLTQDTLTECQYEFEFEVGFEELNFQLRDESNNISPNKKINIGNHSFTEVYVLSAATLPQNQHNLVTQMSGVWPYWESQFSWPQQGPYCLAGGNISTPNPQYPTATLDLQRVIIDGITFLSQNTTNQNSTSTTKTEYESFKFLPSGQTAASSGCTGVPIEYNFFNNPPYTNSIPFYVL